MKTKLLLLTAFAGVSCSSENGVPRRTHIIELYSDGVIINAWEASDVHLLPQNGGVSFTDLYCNCPVRINGTYIITRAEDQDKLDMLNDEETY